MRVMMAPSHIDISHVQIRYATFPGTGSRPIYIEQTIGPKDQTPKAHGLCIFQAHIIKTVNSVPI